MRVLDLFAGIGGFSLGLERAGMRTVGFCEIDPYCRRVLARHWPNVPCHDDIRTFRPPAGSADVVCGGFPCQDISFAGGGAGLAAPRSGLWTEFARIIGAIRPRFAIVENVAALLGRGMGGVLGDLAGIGYDTEWSVVSACSLGAPHVRRRVFIVAYPNGQHGRERIWNSLAQEGGALQTINGGPRYRPGWRAWLANPSELYGGANGLPQGMERNRALGNAIVPQIAEIIGKAIMAAEAS